MQFYEMLYDKVPDVSTKLRASKSLCGLLRRLKFVFLIRRVTVRVPEDAFELNYVFTDGEGASDNNEGKNYLTAVKGTMTPEGWAELAIDRQVSYLTQAYRTHSCAMM